MPELKRVELKQSVRVEAGSQNWLQGSEAAVSEAIRRGANFSSISGRMVGACCGCRQLWMPPVVDAASCGCRQLWMPPVVNAAIWFAF